MRAGRIWATTIAQLKMMFRRRVALFWSFVFPIILLTLLGLLFGRSIDAGTITVIDRSQTAQAQADGRRARPHRRRHRQAQHEVGGRRAEARQGR